MTAPDETELAAESPARPNARLAERAVRWRGEPASRFSSLKTRLLQATLALIFVAGLGAILGLISFVEEVPNPKFIGIWATSNDSIETGLHGPLENDRLAIASSQLFRHVNRKLLDRPQRQRILNEIASLSSADASQAVVVYVSAFASIDKDGDAFFLPHGANAAEQADRVYLSRLLDLLKEAATNEKLLVLDISWPFAIPKLEMFSDDVTSAIEREIAEVDDPNLLTLNSCSPGQVAWTMMAPRRSTFGYFFEQGIIGAADGFGDPTGTRQDGRVTVNELAAYLTSHVDQYSGRASPARQTPILLGNGRDFEIASCVALNEGSDTAHASIDNSKPEQGFPIWLSNAWKIRDTAVANDAWKVDPHLLRQFESKILQAEMNWSRGGQEDEIAQRLEADLKKLATQFNAQVRKVTSVQPSDFNSQTISVFELSKPPESIESATSPPVAAVIDELCPMQIAALFKSLKSARKITPADKWPAAQAKQLDDYSKANAAVSDTALSAGLFRFATHSAELDIQQISTLVEIWQRRSQDPVDLKSAILLDLNRTKLPIQIQKTLRLIDASEQPFDRPQTWGWIGDLRNSADDRRYVAESLFWNSDYVSENAIDQRVAAAMAELVNVFGLANRIETAMNTRDLAVWRLPSFTKLTRNRGEKTNRWTVAAAQATRLASALRQTDSQYDQMASSQIELSKRIESTATDAAGLQTLLDQLQRPYSDATLDQLVNEASSAVPSSLRLTKLQNILSTTLVDGKTRVKLHEILLQQSAALHRNSIETDALIRLNPRSGLSSQDRTRAIELASLRACDRKSNFTNVAKIDQIENDSITQTENGTQSCVNQFWAHRANLYGKLSQHAPPALASFYQGLAQKYRKATPISIRPAIDISPSSVDRELSAAHPQSQHILTVKENRNLIQNSEPQHPFRTASARSFAKNGDESRLQIEILPSRTAGLETAATLKSASSQLRLDISFQPGTAPQQLAKNRGLFVELESNQQRFLHKVDLPELSKAPPIEVFLGETVNDSGPFSTEIRLRPSQEFQPRRLFARNLTDTVQQIAISANDLKATCTLQPKETQLVVFPGKPPKPDEPLPAIANQLSVEVSSAKTGRPILSRVFRIVVASPKEYVELVRCKFVPFQGGRNRLEATLRGTKRFEGPDCIAELVLDPKNIPGLRSVEGGKLKAVVPADGRPVTLYADNLQLEEVVDQNGQFEISIDGAPRTFVLDAVFARQGNPTTPRLVAKPGIGIVANSQGLAGPNFSVALQPVNLAVDSSLSLTLGQSDSLTPADRSFRFATPFKTRLGFATDGKGELVFTAVISDWHIKVDTSGLVGTRQLVCESMLGDIVTGRSQRYVSLDDRAAHTVRFKSLPDRIAAGEKHIFQISGYSELTGIESAQIFIGEPEENAIPKSAKTATCQPANEKRTDWFAELKTPKKLGELIITAAVKNGAGLMTFETQAIEVVDAAEINKGEIAGQVFESVRIQPRLDVVLLNAKGQPVAKTTTGFDGRFKFSSVVQGDYILESFKPASGRSGRTSVKVSAGQTSSVDISLGL